MSDYALGATIYWPFTTRAFATGVPTALAGSPTLEIYEDAGTSPIVEGASKLVLTQNLNSINGFNMATITATTGNGFEDGKTYTLIIKTGTVGGTSVVGEVVGRFTLGVIADSVWDEVLTGATHNVTNSAGKRLRQIDAAFEVHSGTATAGTAGTITLQNTASATNNIYNGDRIIIVGGTGAQEHGIITAYNGTTFVATMSKNWVITPDATSEYEIVPADADIETINNVTVIGAGTSGDLWRA